MRNKCLLTIVISFISLVTLAQGTISVRVKDVETDIGKVIFMLFNDENEFSPTGKVFKREKAKAKKGDVFYKFENIPLGTYALMVSHDENDNNVIDKNFVGFPKEPVGASYHTKFGKPTFDKSKFRISNENPNIEIELIFIN